MADDTAKNPFNRVTNPDGTPPRDKDNAQPVLKPTFSARPAPNLAPAGMLGIRQPHQVSTERTEALKQPPKEKIQFREPKSSRSQDHKQSGITIDGGKLDQDLWVEGKIVTMPGYTFAAKVYDQPSQFGIENGKISKLQIKKDGNQVVNFDRGWDEPPRTAEQKEAVQRIRKGLDDAPERKPFKGSDRNNGKGHGLDR